MGVKIEINGTAKEIADLVITLQSQQTEIVPTVMIDGKKIAEAVSNAIWRALSD